MTRYFKVAAIALALVFLCAAAGVITYFEMITMDAERAATSFSGDPMAIRHGKYLTPVGIAMMSTPQKWVFLLAPLVVAAFLTIAARYLGRVAMVASAVAFAATSGVALAMSWLWVFQ